MAKTTEQKEEVTQPVLKNETVEVSKETLGQILSSIDDLKKSSEEKDKQIAMLTKVADKSRLEWAGVKEQIATGTKCKISTLEVLNDEGEMVHKVILAWRMVRNEVFKDPITMAWREDQQMEVVFEDNTKQKIDYLNFIKSYVKIDVDIIESRVESTTGVRTLKVLAANGKEYLIDVTFVN